MKLTELLKEAGIIPSTTPIATSAPATPMDPNLLKAIITGIKNKKPMPIDLNKIHPNDAKVILANTQGVK